MKILTYFLFKIFDDVLIFSLLSNIKTYGENLQRVQFTAKKSVGIQNLMREYHTEPEVLQAGHIFEILDTLCVELFATVKNFDTPVSDEIMVTMKTGTWKMQVNSF